MGTGDGFIALCKQNFLPFVIITATFINRLFVESIKYERNDLYFHKNSLLDSTKTIQRRLFCAHMEEAKVEHSDQLLHTDVRWLSRDRVLERFRDLLLEIHVK